LALAQALTMWMAPQPLHRIMGAAKHSWNALGDNRAITWPRQAAEGIPLAQGKN